MKKADGCFFFWHLCRLFATVYVVYNLVHFGTTLEKHCMKDPDAVHDRQNVKWETLAYQAVFSCHVTSVSIFMLDYVMRPEIYVHSEPVKHSERGNKEV